MSRPFRDRFGAQAGQYASHRPTYPDGLFAVLAQQCIRTEHAWDCATGNGQAALALAAHFDRITATDASAGQLGQATPHERVTYREASAEASGLDAQSVDLVTVAQALHWFDRPAFFAEVDRVLRPGGLLAVWTYALATISPEVDRVTDGVYRGTLEGYWSPRRQEVEEGYPGYSFPFEPVATPSFAMEVEWPLDRWIGYLRSWSAAEAYRKATGQDPIPDGALASAWGEAQTRLVRWPLTLFLRRKPAAS